MLGKDFKHDLIRKYITIFGLVFNQIYVTRTNENGEVLQKMKVPLSLANKDSMIARLQQDPNIDKPTSIQLPRMAFEMVSMSYAADRHLNKSQQIPYRGDDAAHFNTVFMPVPYDFNFTLWVMVKNYDDGCQIVEQICPFFVPDYSVSTTLIPDLDIRRDIPITLNSVVVNDEFETNFVDRRAIVWTLDFSLKGELYGPIVPRPVINEVDVNVFLGEVGANGFIGSIITKPGLDANGNATSNASISVPANTIWYDDDYGYIITDTLGPRANT